MSCLNCRDLRHRNNLLRTECLELRRGLGRERERLDFVLERCAGAPFDVIGGPVDARAMIDAVMKAEEEE